MSDIFISYARSTLDQAKAVAESLRALGYSVWCDDELPPHRPYADVIQENLSQARAVLVLWSGGAVGSQWVRSEADYARQAGKLVQVSLDGTAPPMPFDQIHCAWLQGAAGSHAGAPDWERVVRSLGDLIGRRPPPTNEPADEASAATHATHSAPAAAAPSLRRSWPLLAAGVAALIVLGLGAWFGLRAPAPAPTPSGGLKVAVLPFETLSAGQEVRFFADSLQDEIAGSLSSGDIQPVSRSDGVRLRGSPQAIASLGARLLLDGTVRNDGGTMRVHVRLFDPTAQAAVWSRDFDAPVADKAVLQARVAHRMIAVLTCSRTMLRLTDPALVGRFLRGCDTFADWDVHVGYDQQGFATWLETQRALTVQAPDFAQAQFNYAAAAAIGSKTATPAMAAFLRREAATHLARGAALEPRAPDADAVRAQLVATTDWGMRERFLRRAVALDPSWSQGNMWLGTMLIETGRLREGVEFTRRSAGGGMVYDWGIFSAILVCGADDARQSLADIERFRKLQPDSVAAQDMVVICLAYQGRWAEARGALAALPQPHLETPYRGAAVEAFLVAAASRRPTDLENARRLALAKAKAGGTSLTTAIFLLSGLGYVDDAFALADRYDPNVWPLHPNVFMFTPLNRNMVRDPRFMRLAARIGLVNYWRKSGQWPDFCADRTLPYDCRAEAAKWAVPPTGQAATPA